jgi:ABC-2 type transport system permease protein
VVSARVRVDLEPRVPAIAVSGTYVLRNNTTSAIDSVHLSVPEVMSIREMTFDGAGEHVVSDSARNYHIYRLARSMQPGDTVVMRFRVEHRKRGFGNQVSDLFLVENGSFMHSLMIMPSIGYNDDLELGDDDSRRKEGLKPKDRMKPPTDTSTLRNNYIGIDSDWIDFEATVSTDPDQTALAPGYLQREWMENGRRFFHYTMDTPILNFWAVVSARYEVKRDRWEPTGAATGEPVDIAVYYHPAHTYNIDRMITSVKRSLDYFTSQFGPYQHRQVRIVEFPRYLAFAQSLPNLIPYSEAVGFIARVRNDNDIDYPFHVTAHEVAHAWWAHQVVGAKAQGATMLSETLAEYSSLMVMEKEYGAPNMRRFLEYELDGYLMGRTTEARREMPLQLVESQPYIHYQKGALAMYALRDYIGEARVNGALRRFLEAQRFKGPPYPTSLQLVRELRAATPDSLRYLITDLFETITLYELRTDSAVVTDAPGQPGRFQVDLWVNARKQRADSGGRTMDIGMRDWMDVGVFAEVKGDSAKRYDRIGMPLYLRKHPVDSGAQRFSVTVDRKPTRAGIDPLHKLVDRFIMNNTVKIKDRTVQ